MPKRRKDEIEAEQPLPTDVLRKLATQSFQVNRASPDVALAVGLALAMIDDYPDLAAETRRTVRIDTFGTSPSRICFDNGACWGSASQSALQTGLAALGLLRTAERLHPNLPSTYATSTMSPVTYLKLQGVSGDVAIRAVPLLDPMLVDVLLPAGRELPQWSHETVVLRSIGAAWLPKLRDARADYIRVRRVTTVTQVGPVRAAVLADTAVSLSEDVLRDHARTVGAAVYVYPVGVSGPVAHRLAWTFDGSGPGFRVDFGRVPGVATDRKGRSALVRPGTRWQDVLADATVRRSEREENSGDGVRAERQGGAGGHSAGG